MSDEENRYEDRYPPPWYWTSNSAPQWYTTTSTNTAPSDPIQKLLEEALGVPATLWGYQVGDGVDVRVSKGEPWKAGTVVRLSSSRHVFVKLVRENTVMEVTLPMNIRRYTAPASLEDVDKFLEG